MRFIIIFSLKAAQASPIKLKMMIKCAGGLPEEDAFSYDAQFSAGSWPGAARRPSEEAAFNKNLLFRSDPGPELPRDFPKKTLLIKIRNFRLDPGPELPRNFPKRTLLGNARTSRPDSRPELPGNRPKKTLLGNICASRSDLRGLVGFGCVAGFGCGGWGTGRMVGVSFVGLSRVEHNSLRTLRVRHRHAGSDTSTVGFVDS